MENYPKEIEVNKVYSYVAKGGYDVGMELKFLGCNELTKEGLKSLYRESIIHMKKRENFIRQITFFGIDDKGNFYEKRQIKSNRYSIEKFAKDFFKRKEDFSSARIEVAIYILDRDYDLGVKKLYDDLQKENSMSNFNPIRKKILNKKEKSFER